ncbi:MAG: toll/interleukin-1 receptor domain-containing protein [Candidatus Thorarchaeota archaeon]
MTINNIYDLLQDLEDFLISKYKPEIWVYNRKNYYGALLIKNSGNDKRLLIKASDSINPLGGSRIEKTIYKTSTFRGYEIDNYIIIARTFKDNAKRLAKVNRELTLISVDEENLGLTIFGSMNIDLNILNYFVEYSNERGISISYDFEGLLKHQGFDNNKQKTITQIEERQANPSVFFSYSWDSESHKFWVLKLASDLIKNGINVIIDEWDLEKYRDDLKYFMESGIREADKVILICTPNYAQKTNNREGGVGVENTIITGEFYDKSKSNKYLTIVKDYKQEFTECLPSYLKTKYAIDFNISNNYKQKFDELIRKILNIPKYKKPKLGKLPNLKSDEI